MDIYGQALSDFYNNKFTDTLWVNNSYAEAEEMPVDVFFRSQEEMPDIELLALENCRGKILDIGAGAGSHALLLQQHKFDVSAIELSSTACHVMELRGVKKVINTSIFDYEAARFDTLLLLMNGIGLCGTIQGLRTFLAHARKLLKKDGQLLFDSSDIAYLYAEGIKRPKTYYGEIAFQYEYKATKGEWFKWLYIDQDTLKKVAAEEDWSLEVLMEDENDQYLAKMQPVENA